jgi:L-threonylcarbamoyladenylate synthase
LLNFSSEQIAAAVGALRNGDLIGYPTEAVWGLGCDPYCEAAVSKILALKSRPVSKGLILIAGSFDQVEKLLIHLSPVQIDLLKASWPGPTTWVIEDGDNQIPSWIKGQFSSVAVRVTNHTGVVALCESFGGYIVSTSLNPSGIQPAVSESQSRIYFRESVKVFISGQTCGRSDSSAIKSLTSGDVLR